MPIEKLKPTFSLDEERLRALEQVVPEAFADGRVNWEVLRESLGERVEDEEAGTEHFGLFWPGKREARRLAAQPSKGTLVPALGEGVDEETTENIFIEGDNLEVLKLLQKSYSGRIKMIYIDPPYNTGRDLIYKDNYKQSVEEYLRQTGQKDVEEGILLTTNPKTSGRFHSNWLNMMYPRLSLAKNLLRKDGVIFISTDSNEVHNLKQLMNELYGEENYVATVCVVSNWKGRSDDKYIATAHEYLTIYQLGEFETLGLPLPEDYLDDYPERDEAGKAFRLLGLRKRGSGARREDRPKMFYPFYVDKQTGKVSLTKDTPDMIEVLPRLSDGTDGRWRWGKTTSAERIEELTTRKVSGTDRYDVFEIDYAEVDGDLRRIRPKSFWNDKTLSNEAGTLAYKALMKNIPFSNPKPPELIKQCLLQSTSRDDLVLDFFAGSGSTAQAIVELNMEDDGNRKYICVQYPEMIEVNNAAFKAGYKTIADIAKERIRRVGHRIKAELESRLDLGEPKFDIGFKVFKLNQSNFQAWQDYSGDDIRQLEILFASHETPFVEGWKEQDVLTELLLIEGFPLNSKITPDDTFSANHVLHVESDFSAHRLFICLEPRINDETIERVSELPREDIFICLDSALTDAAKVRLTDVGNVRTI
jgi:adenine-specific DNA-methyltransferase